MKNWPAPTPRPRAMRRCIPAFHPVPVAPRADGWTMQRQADFIGYLVQTRSVIAAARLVGMGRESAYRLRCRPGAAGFAAAWDAALGKPHIPVDLASAKATGLPAAYRHQTGRLQVVMADGRYAGTHWKPDDTALLQHLAQLDRALRAQDGKSQSLHAPSASPPSGTGAGPGDVPPFRCSAVHEVATSEDGTCRHA